MGFENLIIHDLIGFAKHDSERSKVCVTGANFGAYHALNLAFRHPDLISYLICMSGAYNIKQFIMDYYDDNCYFNNPPDYMPDPSDEWYFEKIRKMGIILGTGDGICA